MEPKLTPEQQERVEQDLADLFVFECHDLIAEMGLEFPLSAEDDRRLNEEFDRRNRDQIVTRVLLARSDA